MLYANHIPLQHLQKFVKQLDESICSLHEAARSQEEKERRQRAKKELQKSLLEKYKKSPNIPANLKESENGEFIEDEDGVKRKLYSNRGIKYEIKPFGAGKEKIMSDLEPVGQFCVYINSENYKFIALNDAEDNLGLALHIAESMIRELTRYKNPLANKNEVNNKTVKH